MELGDIAWSPDGTRIALGTYSVAQASTYNGLHVIDLDTGRDRQLTKDAYKQPAWSPDGAWLAYDAYAFGTISLVRADGSRHLTLNTGMEERATSPTWSPDGTRLAFQSASSIYTIALDGTRLRRLARNAASPAWSP